MPYSSGLKRNIVQCLDDYNIPIKYSHTITRVEGKPRMTGLWYAPVGADRKPDLSKEEYVACDTLLLSVGLIPENELTKKADIDLARSFNRRHPLPQGRVIAVNGSIASLQEALQTRVWFDQKGVLIQRLQIHELPAWVTLTAQTIEVKTGSTEALLPLVTQTTQGSL